MTSLLRVVPVPDLDGRNAIGRNAMLCDLTGPASLISDQSRVNVYALSLRYAVVT